MAKLGEALDVNPFESEAGLGPALDFNPFEASSRVPPDERELNLPPLEGAAAPGIPLPPERERPVPLPTARPAAAAEEEGALSRTLAALGDIPEAVLRGYYGAKTGANILGVETGQVSPEEAAANIAENIKKGKEVAMPESVRKGMEALQKAKGWKETFQALADHPDVLPSVLGESAASSLVSTGTGLIGALTGATVGSVVPVVGTAAGATAGLVAGVGAGSAATEYASTLNDFLTSQGIDTSDPEQLKAAFSNPEIMAAARKDAAIRGVAVGAFDALTAGVAGKLFGPVKKALGEGAVGAVLGTGAEIGTQALGGAGGEAAAQLGTKGEITSPSDIALEAAGEIIPGLGEVAISKLTGASPSEKVQPTAEAPAAPPSPEQPVEAPGPEAAPAPEAAAPAAPEAAPPAPIPANEDIAILKGANYDIEQILDMSPRELAAKVRDARESGIQPVELSAEDIAAIEAAKPAALGEPVAQPEGLPAPEEAPLPPVAAPEPVAPSARGAELVQEGVPPLEAMKKAAEEPIAPAPVEVAPVEVPPAAEAPAEPQKKVFEPGLDPLELAASGKLSSADVDRIFNEVKNRGTKIENEVLGDRAEEWRKAHRGLEMAANRADDAAMDKYSKIIAEIENNLPEKDYNRLYGSGEAEGTNPEDWKDLRGRIGAVESGDDDAIRSLMYELRRIPTGPIEDMSFNDKATLAVIQRALDAARENGRDPREFLKQAFEDRYRMVLRDLGDENDARFLVTKEMEDLSKLINIPEAPKPAPEVTKLPAPEAVAPEAPPAAKPEVVRIVSARKGASWIIKGMDATGKKVFQLDPIKQSDVARDTIYRLVGENPKATLGVHRKILPKGMASVSMRKPPEGFNTLRSFIERIGGIKEEGGELAARNIPERLIRDTGVSHEEATRRAIDAGFFPDYVPPALRAGEESYQAPPEMVDRFREALGQKRFDLPKKPEDAEAAQKRKEADIESDVLGPYMKDIKDHLKKSGQSLSDTDIRDAAILLHNGELETPKQAVDYLHVLNDMEIMGDEMTDLDRENLSKIMGEDIWDDIQSLANLRGEGELRPEGVEPLTLGETDEFRSPEIPEAGAIPREEVKPAPRPAEKEAPKAVSKPVEKEGAGKPEAVKVKYPDWLTQNKQDVPVYHNKDLGISFDYSVVNGEPFYFFRKKRVYKLGGEDVESSYLNFPTNDDAKIIEQGGFNKEDLIELRKALDDYIAKDLEEYNKNPNGPFGEERFAKSENIPDGIFNLMKDWANMLGLEKRIYLTTPADAGAKEFHGPFKRINSLARYDHPLKQPLVGGDHVILLPIRPRISYNIEALAHEMGHILENQGWKNSTDEEKNAIMDDFKKWLDKHKESNAGKIIKDLRAHVTGKLFKFQGNENLPPSKTPGYYRSFSEYFADNVARYMVSEPKPQSVVGKFFARIADGLKRLYQSVAGINKKASKSMKEYLDARINRFDNVLDGTMPEMASPKEGVIQESRSSLSQETIDEIEELNRKYGMPKDIAPTKPDTPTETKLDKFRAKVQDVQIFLRKVQDEIEKKNGGPLIDTMNAYARNLLMPGRISERIHDLNKDMVKPLFKRMKDLGISLDDLHKYMLAKHAPERNREMAKRDPERFGTLFDGGSGLTNGAAEELLARLEPKKEALEELSGMVRKIIDSDLDRRVEAGLMTEDQAKGLKELYKDYVPLRGFAERDMEEDHGGTFYNLGKGLTVSKEEYKKAMGRKSQADNVVLNAIMQAEEGIYRAEKNRALEALYNLAKLNPNPDLWQIGKMKAHKVIGEDGLVKWELDGMVGPNTVVVKIGGKPYYIDLKNPALAEAYGRLGPLPMARWFRPIATMTRAWSQLQTSKNPAFIATNFQRDLADALFYTYGKDADVAKEVVKSLPEALKLTTKATLQKLSPEEQKIFDEWRRSGGRISYNAITDIQEKSGEFNRLVGDVSPLEWYKLPQKTQRLAEKAFYKVVDGLEKVAQPFEDGVRASVFIAARKVKNKDGTNKYTVEQAARMAQEASVNFYRKGRYSPYLNGLYAFFNASTQGSAMGLKLLKDSKKARLAFMSMVPFSFMITMMNLGNSDDDPMQKGRKNYMNIPEFERETGLVIKYGKGPKDYFKIRMPSLLMIPIIMGEQAALAALGQQKLGKSVGNMFGGAINAFNPLGSSSLIGMVSPTLTDPIVDILVNKKYSGAPIHPQPAPWNTGIPNSEQAFSTTAPWASALTRTIYKGTAGAVDIYPGDAEYVANWMIGGLGRNTGNVISFIKDIAQGKDPKISDLPIIRTFAPTQWNPGGRYYELHDAVDGKVNRLRALAKDMAVKPSKEKIQEFNKEAAGTGIYFDGEKVVTSGAPAISAMRNADSILKQLRQQSIAVQNDARLSPRQQQQKVEAIKAQMERVMVGAGKQMSIFDPRPSFGPLSNLVK